MRSTQEERTMTDLDKVMRDLYAMRDYFTVCAGNASPGSEAREMFAGYVQTLTCLAIEIEEMLTGEDDGK
jgi:hypothetical protein